MRSRLFCLVLCLSLLPLGANAAESPVTRGQCLLFLWQSAGGVPYDITAHPFTDLDGRDELAQAAGWAYDQGLIKGVGDSLFAPDRPLTREECATLLRRYDASRGLDVWLPDGAAACNDYADISPWADDSLYWACIMGRMDWRNCRLAPLEFVTLSEAEALFPPLGENAMERGHFTSFSSSSQV